MSTREEMLQVWHSFVKSRVDDWVQVIFADEPGTRPKNPYVTIKMISGPRALGSFDELLSIANSTKYTVSGMRQFTLNLQGFGTEAIDILDRLQSLLDDPATGLFLRAESDMAIVSKGAVTDITELMETGYEPRASMDIIFNTSRNVEVDPSSIETVAIGGEISGAISGDITVENFEIKKP